VNYKNNFLLRCLTFITFLLSSGCATLEGPPNPDDPFEGFNRTVFEFNERFDKYAFKPVAKGYDFIMPSFASKGVSNFFSNIDDIVVFFNQLLQFKFAAAAMTSARFVFNTTFGLLGFIDVSSHLDLPKQHEDFGQTLAVWGVPQGPYMVLPFIGPITARDTAGLAVDWTYFDPIFKRQTLRQSLATLAIKYIDIRAGLLTATNIIDETAPDKYSFIRDAWLLRREFLIYDGFPPDELTEDELFDDNDLFNDDDLLQEGNINNNSALETEATPSANDSANTESNTTESLDLETIE
jgi:phospholipid-binding lipoprotein MlaA